MESLLSKSELTDKDPLEIGKKITKKAAKKYRKA